MTDASGTFLHKRIVIDANIFITSWVTDLLLSSSAQGLFIPLASEDILLEVREHIATAWKKVPSADPQRYVSQLARYLSDMRRIVDGYSQLIASVELPDPDDRHVLAAAIQGHAQYILTWNIKDFPPSSLAAYDIRAITPDELMSQLFHAAPQQVLSAISAIVREKNHPPRTLEEELDGLSRNRLAHFVSLVRKRYPRHQS